MRKENIQTNSLYFQKRCGVTHFNKHLRFRSNTRKMSILGNAGASLDLRGYSYPQQGLIYLIFLCYPL